MSVSIEMYDMEKIEWPDILDETVILEMYSSDQVQAVCMHAYLWLWAVRVMVTQKMKVAQSRPALQKKTPLTMSNTYNTAKMDNY